MEKKFLKNLFEFVAKNKSFLKKHQLSFFEMTVGLAFEYFVKEQTDINIMKLEWAED
jgi:dihydrofolate synthase/folylpolyglutamate synthase